MDEKTETRWTGQVIRIGEARIRDHLGEMVRGTVEEALNAMLEAEADRLCGAGRYERSESRQDSRAGHDERNLETKAGKVSLKVPKLRRQTFGIVIIERYRRRESSVEEALIEMYLASVPVRAAELVEAHVGETLTFYAFPDCHWIKLRSNDPLERIMREIRRRTRVVGAVLDVRSCLNLAAARLRHIAAAQWSSQKYTNMGPLHAAKSKAYGPVVA